MGGVSTGTLTVESVAARRALRMRAEVSLANGGGFVQMSLDLVPGGGAFDARGWTGIELEVCGNGQSYGVHLRTAHLTRPWQSYRQSFLASQKWMTVRVPFTGFTPYRVSLPLDAGCLRRVGLVAIGRAFSADLALAGLRLYR